MNTDILEHSFNPASHPLVRKRLARDFDAKYQRWGGKFFAHGLPPGRGSLRLDGNDYLSITGTPSIVKAQVEALQDSEPVVIQSPVLLLDEHPARKLEMELARWVHKQDAVLVQSGYMANIGLIQSIASADTPVYLDALAHASLWEGARSACAQAHLVRHNNPGHLATMLERHGPGLVVVDSIYSTTGAICHLRETLDVVERYGAMLLVDESHSLGTHGERGAGICALLGLTDRVHFITASLAKSVAGRAGFFTTSPQLRHHILSSSSPLIFSSCLLPFEIAGLAAAVQVVQAADKSRARLVTITRRVRTALAAMGYPIGQGTEQIVALESGTETATNQLRNEMEQRGVFGAVFAPPATSLKRCMVRITLNAGLSDADIDRFVGVMRSIAPIVKPEQWPISKRHRQPEQPIAA